MNPMQKRILADDIDAKLFSLYESNQLNREQFNHLHRLNQKFGTQANAELLKCSVNELEGFIKEKA